MSLKILLPMRTRLNGHLRAASW